MSDIHGLTQNNDKQYCLKVLGITGGIASGKSTAAGILRDNGGYILDADKISHAALKRGNPAYDETLLAITGDYVNADGQIDRKKLGAIVFNDAEKLKTLETIVHRQVVAIIETEICEARQSSSVYKFIVIDAPLLTESGLHKICDEVWVIRADYDERINRLMIRNSLTRQQAANRIIIQTDWENIQNSDFIFIDNNGNADELHGEINKRLAKFLQ